jgi:prolyl-tRNA synthetase
MARRAYCSCTVEAVEESEKMMNVYADFAKNFMAIPVVKDLKQKQSVCWCRRNILYRSINARWKALQAELPFLGQKFLKL